ncbi:hypothetical protein ScPMuIL_016918 [Solemya velum]
MPGKKEFSRLSLDVKPINYSLRMKPNLKAFTFEGSEDIDVEVGKSTNQVSLNSSEIEVLDVYFQHEGSDEKQKAEIAYEKENEKVIFTFPAALQTGKGVLSVKFSGILNDQMKGFYRSKFKTSDGQEGFHAVTQFEACDARRAFPCWDEPAVKATFDITLVLPQNKLGLSNMPVEKESPLESDPTMKVQKHTRSPVMSTYLLALIVGEFDHVEAKDEDGVLVRVFTPVGKKEQGKFALEVALKTLPFYKKYFQIAYPLPKMDLIAIPDFSAGAMENWGLVTYRETALLIDPDNSSSKVKQWVALVVGHELAHQWFGNLVTMEWWTHLWLNEGFASWIEYLCVDHCFPEFDIWTQFVTQDLGRALELDALDNSHPIEVPVGHPDEVDEIFDAISYSKGASVIRMLHDYMGDEDFKKGMNIYLTKFKYGNTFTEDLWDSLEKVSGKPIRELMSTWTKQMGFPVIKVEQKRDGSTRVLTITQEKFCADGKKPEASFQWMVPISISTSASPDKPAKIILLNSPTTTVTLEDVKEDQWVKLNCGSVGVFRVQYDTDMLDALLPAIKDKSLPSRDRLGLQNDLFALCRAGLISSVDVLKVASAFVNEDDFTVWSDLFANLSNIAVLLQYTEYYDHYKSFIVDLISPVAERLGWEVKENEGPLMGMLRDLVLGKLGRYNHKTTVEEARRRFDGHISKSKPVPADLRGSVYSTVLSHGDEDVFQKMITLHNESDFLEEKTRISRLLGLIKDPKLMQKVLEFALSEHVRAQDTVFVIGGVTASKEGRDMTWRFVQDNWKELHHRYQGGFLLSRLVKMVTECFVTAEKLKEVQDFFETHPAPAAERTVQQSCENIQLNIKWMERDSVAVGDYLKNRN